MFATVFVLLLIVTSAVISRQVGAASQAQTSSMQALLLLSW